LFELLASLTLSACTVEASRTRSPNGTYIAIVRITDAGALSSVTQRVLIRRADEGEAAAVECLVTTGAHRILLRWNGDSELAVECPTCDAGRVEVKKERVGAVNVQYPRFGTLFRSE
jgi:hypothetical protein